MEKLARKIFQPTPLTNELLEGICSSGDINISQFVNTAIIEYYTPRCEALKREVEFLFERMNNHEDISQKELQATLSRAVEALKEYPISDVRPLEQIFIHFTNTLQRVLRYDYIVIVDIMQDEKLHRLNDILKTVDEDFTLGTREFGERAKYVFKHWDVLCGYSEIYSALATIIDCENIYRKLTKFRVIDLIKWLDIAIQSSKLTPIKTPFETNISLTAKYYGIRYEVSVYHTDNGYCALSGDESFERMSPEIKKYYNKYMHNDPPHGEATEDDINNIVELEKEGRFLFRRLSKKNSKN